MCKIDDPDQDTFRPGVLSLEALAREETGNGRATGRPYHRTAGRLEGKRPWHTLGRRKQTTNCAGRLRGLRRNCRSIASKPKPCIDTSAS
jgi:hypothetical protein